MQTIFRFLNLFIMHTTISFLNHYKKLFKKFKENKMYIITDFIFF